MISDYQLFNCITLFITHEINPENDITDNQKS